MAPIDVQQASSSTLSSNQDGVSDSLLSTASPPTIAIRQFRAEDLTQVLELFQDGLTSYTHEDDPLYPVWVDYIAASLKKDMADILGHYVGGGGNFWVPTATNSHPSDPKEPGATHPASTTVVGTFAIQKHSDDVGEFRRVSVRADHRRFGIGKLLFNHAQQWAKEEQKFKKLELSCSVKQAQAHRFYEAQGFRYVRTSAMCQDPLFENVHYVKLL